MAKVVNDTAIADTIVEARAIAGRPRFWMALLGAGFVIGLVGPFGTYAAMPAPVRIAYWLAVAATTFWIGYLASFAAASLVEARGMAGPWSVGIGAAAASLPVAAWLASLHAVLFAAPFWAEALRLLPYVAVIAVAVAALYEGVEARDVWTAPTDQPTKEPAWLDRLPAHLGRDLILLQAQDHYVRAETARGDTLIRTTIQEAASDLCDYGVRVHRSWWVARGWIQSHQYRQGKPVLILRNGREVPVGRTYRRGVREALRSG